MAFQYLGEFAEIDLEEEEKRLNDQPWKAKLLENLQKMLKKYTLIWLRIATSIDRNENVEYTGIFYKAIENVLGDLTGDMYCLHEEHVRIVARCSSKLQQLEQKLRLESSTENMLGNDMSLKEMTETMKEKIENLEKDLEKKQHDLENLNKKYKDLSRKLGFPGKYQLDTDSPNSVETFKEKLQVLEEECFNREKQFLSRKSDIQKMISNCGILDETLNFEFLELSLDSYKITDDDLAKIEKIYSRMEELRNELSAKIGSLKKQLENLWEELDSSSEDRLNFVSSLETCSVKTVEKLEREIARLTASKQNRLQELIEMQKKKLDKLWDVCHCDGTIRSDFPLCYTAEYNNEILSIFRTEVLKWEKYYEENQEILETLNVYTNLTNEQFELEINTDKNKLYQNRGGKLLTELRKMNILKCRIKKTEKKLLKMAEFYMKKKNKPFLTYGETIEDLIKKNKKKMSEMTPKKDALMSVKTVRTQIQKTPSSASAITPRSGASGKTHVGSVVKKKTLPSERLQRKKTPSKRGTPVLPTLKLNESKVNSPQKKLVWKPSRLSLKLAKESDDESWTSYDDFEEEAKYTPRSTSYFQQN